jgi:hypothetical protein
MGAMSGAERQRRHRQKMILLGKSKPYKNTWEEAFRKFAIERGWETTKRGWPDFLCLSKDGEWFVVEVKPPGRKTRGLSAPQSNCMDFLSALGARCYVFNGEKMVRYVTRFVMGSNGQSNVTKKLRHSLRHTADKLLNEKEDLDEKPIKRKRGSLIDSNWNLSLEERQYAIALGLDPDRTADEFRDYWIAKTGQGAVKADWSATWRNWCRRAQDYGRQKSTNGAVNGHANGSSQLDISLHTGPTEPPPGFEGSWVPVDRTH